MVDFFIVSYKEPWIELLKQTWANYQNFASATVLHYYTVYAIFLGTGQDKEILLICYIFFLTLKEY